MSQNYQTGVLGRPAVMGRKRPIGVMSSEKQPEAKMLCDMICQVVAIFITTPTRQNYAKNHARNLTQVSIQNNHNCQNKNLASAGVFW